METSINTIFFQIILYSKDQIWDRSGRFEIAKLGRIVDLEMNFKNLY